jgi:hypothetical protein
MRFILFITIIFICCAIILADSIYLSNINENLTTIDQKSVMSNGYDTQFHESIEDIKKQVDTYLPQMQSVSVKDSSGNPISIDIPKYMGWNDYYSPGTYKYGSSFYVPDYEDSIYLSRSIGVVPRLKSNYYVSDDNYELNSLETPYNESDVLITNKWVNQVSTGSRILPTERPENNNYNNTDKNNRSAQLQVTYTMTKSSDELAYEREMAAKDKIQSQILGYATNAPLNIQPKYSRKPITNK